MSVKIQISSLDALERLIGGDTELEIELRNSVVQNFAHKHLKALVNPNLMAPYVNEVADNIRKEFTSEIKDGWNTKRVLRSEILEQLKVSLATVAQIELRKVVEESLEFAKAKKSIDEAIERTVYYIDVELRKKVLQEKVDALVAEKLKAALKL
jgi:hypothetical protein